MQISQTEEQQVEAIQKFWQANKKIIFASILLFSCGYFAVKYYQHHKETNAETASYKYSLMLEAMKNQDKFSVDNYANELIKDYKPTPYSALACLHLAKTAMDEGKTQDAINNLKWIIDNKSSGSILNVATLRLARIYRAEGELDKALELLDKNANGFTSLFEEIKGDIYLDKKDLSKAKKHYESAMQSAPKTGATPWLQLKIEDLSGVK